GPKGPEHVEDAFLGEVRGTVVDAETEAPLSGARIFVRGASAETRTDALGGFRLALPAGAWDLTAIAVGYRTGLSKSVQVVAGEAAHTQLRLRPRARELGEVVVLAPKLEGNAVMMLEERRESSS